MVDWLSIHADQVCLSVFRESTIFCCAVLIVFPFAQERYVLVELKNTKRPNDVDFISALLHVARRDAVPKTIDCLETLRLVVFHDSHLLRDWDGAFSRNQNMRSLFDWSIGH